MKIAYTESLKNFCMHFWLNNVLPLIPQQVIRWFRGSLKLEFLANALQNKQSVLDKSNK